MACAEFENRIADYLEEQLPPGGRQAVETHLAACAECRAFCAQLRELDAALACAVKAPALGADFSARVRRRVEAEPVRWSAAERAERLRQAEADFQTRVARLRRRSLGLLSLLDGIGYAALAGLLLCFLYRLGPSLASAGSVAAGIPEQQALRLAWITGAVFVLFGIGAAFRRQLLKLIGNCFLTPGG
jgi:anti-sigma factor RsiW